MKSRRRRSLFDERPLGFGADALQKPRLTSPSWWHLACVAGVQVRSIKSLGSQRPGPGLASVALKSVTLDNGASGPILRITFVNGISLCAVQPCVVRVQMDDGAERALEVETADGGCIRLAFRAAALPEQLDGVAPGGLIGEALA